MYKLGNELICSLKTWAYTCLAIIVQNIKKVYDILMFRNLPKNLTIWCWYIIVIICFPNWLLLFTSVHSKVQKINVEIAEEGTQIGKVFFKDSFAVYYGCWQRCHLPKSIHHWPSSSHTESGHTASFYKASQNLGRQ